MKSKQYGKELDHIYNSFSFSFSFNDIKPLAFGFASHCSGISISAGSSLEFLLDCDELLSMPRLGRIRLNGFLYVQIPTVTFFRNAAKPQAKCLQFQGSYCLSFHSLLPVVYSITQTLI